MSYLLILVVIVAIIAGNIYCFRLGQKQERKNNARKNKKTYEKIEVLLKKKSKEAFMSSDNIFTPDFFNEVMKEIRTIIPEKEVKEIKVKEIDSELYSLLKKLFIAASGTHGDNIMNLSFIVRDIKRKFPEFEIN